MMPAELAAVPACVTKSFALARNDPQIYNPAKLASVMAYEFATSFLAEKAIRDEMEKIEKGIDTLVNRV